MKDTHIISPGTDTSFRCSRRSFLLYTLFGILGLEISGCESASTVHEAWLDDISPYPRDAAKIGRGYLVLHPEEADREILKMKINMAIREQVDLTATGSHKMEFSLFEDVIRKEYAQGRMVFLHGWVLSPTEARLYALLSLSPGNV